MITNWNPSKTRARGRLRIRWDDPVIKDIKVWGLQDGGAKCLKEQLQDAKIYYNVQKIRIKRQG